MAGWCGTASAMAPSRPSHAPSREPVGPGRGNDQSQDSSTGPIPLDIPVELTALRLKRTRLPLSWVEQRRLLGFEG